MIVSMVAAMDKNGLIGKNNGLPWPHLDADMKFFIHVTKGKPVIMGHRTFESLKAPLTGRLNVILTRDKSFKAPSGCLVMHSVQDVLQYFQNSEEIVVMGGAQVYAAFLPYAQKMYLSYIDGVFEGDTYFPKFDSNEWFCQRIVAKLPDSKNKYMCTFKTLERKPSSQ